MAVEARIERWHAMAVWRDGVSVRADIAAGNGLVRPDDPSISTLMLAWISTGAV